MSTMSNDPDAIRAEIAKTRSDLSQNVNALGETVAPGNVARHQVSKVTGAANGLKDRVMGAADSATSAGSGAGSSMGDSASQAASATKQRTQGNPMAAGLIALGAGWLLGSLLPASQREQEAAGVVKDKAQPLVDEAKSMAQDSAANLKEPAKEAAASVKDTAQSAAETVKSDASGAAQDVKDSAQDARSELADDGSADAGTDHADHGSTPVHDSTPAHTSGSDLPESQRLG